MPRRGKGGRVRACVRVDVAAGGRRWWAGGQLRVGCVWVGGCAALRALRRTTAVRAPAHKQSAAPHRIALQFCCRLLKALINTVRSYTKLKGKEPINRGKPIHR
jgi:hypothetical protein